MTFSNFLLKFIVRHIEANNDMMGLNGFKVKPYRQQY